MFPAQTRTELFWRLQVNWWWSKLIRQKNEASGFWRSYWANRWNAKWQEHRDARLAPRSPWTYCANPKRERAEVGRTLQVRGVMIFSIIALEIILWVPICAMISFIIDFHNGPLAFPGETFTSNVINLAVAGRCSAWRQQLCTYRSSWNRGEAATDVGAMELWTGRIRQVLRGRCIPVCMSHSISSCCGNDIYGDRTKAVTTGLHPC